MVRKSAADLIKDRPTPSAISAIGARLSTDITDVIPPSAPITPSAISAAIAPSAPSARTDTALPTTYVKRGVELRVDLAQAISDIAFWDRRRVRDVLNEALEEYVARHPPKRE